MVTAIARIRTLSHPDNMAHASSCEWSQKASRLVTLLLTVPTDDNHYQKHQDVDDVYRAMLVSSVDGTQRHIRATSDPSLTLDLLVRLGVSSDESVSLEANDVRTEAIDRTTWRAKAASETC